MSQHLSSWLISNRHSKYARLCVFHGNLIDQGPHRIERRSERKSNNLKIRAFCVPCEATRGSILYMDSMLFAVYMHSHPFDARARASCVEYGGESVGVECWAALHTLQAQHLGCNCANINIIAPVVYGRFAACFTLKTRSRYTRSTCGMPLAVVVAILATYTLRLHTHTRRVYIIHFMKVVLRSHRRSQDQGIHTYTHRHHFYATYNTRIRIRTVRTNVRAFARLVTLGRAMKSAARDQSATTP